MTVQEMAEAMGVQVVTVGHLDAARWVSDCGVLLLPDAMDDDERAEAIAWCVERATQYQAMLDA